MSIIEPSEDMLQRIKDPVHHNERLKWKSCECGCKGVDVTLGNTYLFMYLDNNHVYDSHQGLGKKLYEGTSFHDSDRFARAYIYFREKELQQKSTDAIEFLKQFPEKDNYEKYLVARFKSTNA